MRAIVVVNGELDADARSWICDRDYIIAANGGTRHCLALGLLPNAVVGDLDSVDPAIKEMLLVTGVEIEEYDADKNETDLELALNRAVTMGVDEIVLLGALGGRLDQTIANCLILAQRPWPTPIWLVAGNQVASVLRGGETMEIQGVPGSLVSAIPLSPKVTGITYYGLSYPLYNHTLTFGSTRAISNRLEVCPAVIEVESGLLLVVQAVDRCA